MLSPAEALKKGSGKIKRQWKTAFLAAFVTGLLIHMPAMLSDIPNHDGLSSLYFDQNMITSGRWFLTVACGFSSYYTIPWVIGLLGLLALSAAAVALTELLELRQSWAVVAAGGLLAAFPALTSTFAYVFTLDGYMLALLLAVLAVLFTKKYRYGFLPGGFCLAFSLGTYQGYLAFAMILSVFAILMLAMERKGIWEKVKRGLRYLYMGVLGAVLYYVILQVLLQLQGKELDSYQGISGLSSGSSAAGLPGRIWEMYRDFAAFSVKGNVLWNNWISAAAWILLICAAFAAVILLAVKRKWWKSPWFFVIIVTALLALPLVTNVILLVSPSVTYHLLMRYQWVLFPIGLIALADRHGGEVRGGAVIQWAVLGAAFVLVFYYGVTDNIGYSNLQKKYEKTYAYCVRLLDRIEQTPGYYQGIPIAMMGMVGDEQFPATDLTQHVTSGMIGIYGDSLLYTGENYRLFIQNYLGATLNILPAEAMAEMYYDEAYIAMDSFPGENSIRIMDGILYIKTENIHR
ncbi:MAG: glucosyltransferase domain-containing protein [Butyrivibrio sp.]|nr:glucosyltransferase domain-containing protein [Acetatifactor muris]MCM1559876.1 glucosyltransferase domain-containing protein [Butyrivibrio sp.]